MVKWSRNGFWEKMWFEYKLSFLNENTLEEVFSFRMSRLHVLIVLFLFAVFMITLTSFVIIKTPIRNYLPGYLPIDVRQEIIENALRVDSLENALQIQTQYISNVRAALNGTLEADKIMQTSDSVNDYSGLKLDKSKESADFVRNYDEEERFNLNMRSNTDIKSDKPMFFCPLKGIVSSSFNQQAKHYGIDIAAIENEPILAAQKGTVIFSGFVPETGYVICVQHINGFTTVYKHCAKLLKVQGETVESGEAIALVGNTGRYSTGNHLHFELWQNGIALNPDELINFDRYPIHHTN
ncbi:MAG: M23 family metallopeptidase [Dysgonamonadaceae bacterium]|jgi:lipoprotein NlpD|nr:M23 family metallopeptidase [Dysgonamonadaceae bacterium]